MKIAKPGMLKRWSWIALFVTCAGAMSLAQAQVYKYLDEEGNVYFSDKPPEEPEAEAEVVTIKKEKGVSGVKLPVVAAAVPISNSVGKANRIALLEKVEIEYEHNDETIGKSYKFTPAASNSVAKMRAGDKSPKQPLPCLSHSDLSPNNANYIISKVSFTEPFNTAFEDSGYKVAAKKTFAMQQGASIDLSLAAVITDMRLAHCSHRKASTLDNFTQNSTYLKIDWTVFDNLARKVVYQTTTEGGEYSFKKPARYRGAAVSTELAFENATRHLLAQPEFVAMLQGSKTRNAGFSGQDVSIADINIKRGKADGKFVTKTPQIERAAVTVRTAGGHGSGFVISDPGYVLTNHHVVGGNQEVIVIIGEREQRATVVRSNPGRDVALLKLQQTFTDKPLQINANRVNLGEEIYVVGTPLDESLSFSISRGIISARRRVDERNFYQTDAAVNPGNSGGPVFNASGNVIGITVAGLFTDDGGSMNINYIIPIMDALEALDIKLK